jgi:hypothetical protein
LQASCSMNTLACNRRRDRSRVSCNLTRIWKASVKCVTLHAGSFTLNLRRNISPKRRLIIGGLQGSVSQ